MADEKLKILYLMQLLMDETDQNGIGLEVMGIIQRELCMERQQIISSLEYIFPQAFFIKIIIESLLQINELDL